MDLGDFRLPKQTEMRLLVSNPHQTLSIPSLLHSLALLATGDPGLGRETVCLPWHRGDSSTVPALTSTLPPFCLTKPSISSFLQRLADISCLPPRLQNARPSVELPTSKLCQPTLFDPADAAKSSTAIRSPTLYYRLFRRLLPRNQIRLAIAIALLPPGEPFPSRFFFGPSLNPGVHSRDEASNEMSPV